MIHDVGLEALRSPFERVGICCAFACPLCPPRIAAPPTLLVLGRAVDAREKRSPSRSSLVSACSASAAACDPKEAYHEPKQQPLTLTHNTHTQSHVSMATRLPRCFAAAAAAASASSASTSSSSRPAPPTPAVSTRQQAGANSRRGRREAAAQADAAGYKAAGSSAARWRGGAGGGTEAASALRGPSIEAIQASLQEVLSSVRLVRVAHADAAAVVDGAEGGDSAAADSEATLSPLEDGDKPEYIQRADEQVRGQTW